MPSSTANKLVVLTASALLLLGAQLKAQTSAPKWFGPHAYPVPDMNEALTNGKLSIQLAGECCIGNLAGKGYEDYTAVPSFRISIPLWTDRVNLICWGEFFDWWKDTPQVRELRAYAPSEPLSGFGHGQIWLGLDMMALREKKYSPSLVISANLLTANGGDYEKARHYDAAGYHFSATAGKSFGFGAETDRGWSAGALRLSATVGFVCWQTGKSSQNDAVLVGGMISYNLPVVSASFEYSSYIGWRKNGDAPQTLKARLDFHAGMFSPFVRYAHGVRDWPFDQISAGLRINIDVLKNETGNTHN